MQEYNNKMGRRREMVSRHGPVGKLNAVKADRSVIPLAIA